MKTIFIFGFSLALSLLLYNVRLDGYPQNEKVYADPTGTYVPAEKIVMVWDLILSAEDNLLPKSLTFTEGLDVTAPTWFALSGADAGVSDLGNIEYVSAAHENGIEVWAVFENKSDTNMTYAVLSNEGSRSAAIDEVVYYAGFYGVDGINIDFEAMDAKTGPYFEKMVADLYSLLKPMGITLSVDIPAPSDIENIYNLGEVEKNTDYIVLMAYDQHYAGSEKIGPVADINWVKSLIEQTLQYTSPEKVILGIPFYTIIWREGANGGISSELHGMAEAYETVEQHTKSWVRLPMSQQIYAEYKIGKATYRVWLEDEHSISLKLDQLNDYQLAGLSAWRKGLEWPETWGMINKYFK